MKTDNTAQSKSYEFALRIVTLPTSLQPKTGIRPLKTAPPMWHQHRSKCRRSHQRMLQKRLPPQNHHRLQASPRNLILAPPPPRHSISLLCPISKHPPRYRRTHQNPSLHPNLHPQKFRTKNPQLVIPNSQFLIPNS